MHASRRAVKTPALPSSRAARSAGPIFGRERNSIAAPARATSAVNAGERLSLVRTGCGRTANQAVVTAQLQRIALRPVVSRRRCMIIATTIGANTTAL